MPNWTECMLDIRSPELEVIKTLLFLPADEPGEKPIFSFAALVPMPDILRRTATGGTKDFETYAIQTAGSMIPSQSWYSHDGEDRAFTDAERAELDKIGYANWYDWAYAKWGVKWDASNVEVEEYGPQDLEIKFHTPWGPPTDWYTVLKKRVSCLVRTKIELKYRLEDDDYYPHTLD